MSMRVVLLFCLIFILPVRRGKDKTLIIVECQILTSFPNVLSDSLVEVRQLALIVIALYLVLASAPCLPPSSLSLTGQYRYCFHSSLFLPFSLLPKHP